MNRSSGGLVPSGLQATSVRDQRWWLLAAFVIALGLMSPAALATVGSGGRIHPMDLMSDRSEITGIHHWYVGAVSDLNLFVWAAGAAILFVAALGVRRESGNLSRALAWIGAFTVLFTLDDRFLLHEGVYPRLFGFSQLGTYVVYVAILGSILVWYRDVLLRQPDVVLLILALAFLGASVLLDVAGWDTTVRRVAEETAKMIGAVSWMLFPAAVVVRHLSRAEPGRPDETAGVSGAPHEGLAS